MVELHLGLTSTHSPDNRASDYELSGPATGDVFFSAKLLIYYICFNVRPFMVAHLNAHTTHPSHPNQHTLLIPRSCRLLHNPHQPNPVNEFVICP